MRNVGGGLMGRGDKSWVKGERERRGVFGWASSRAWPLGVDTVCVCQG